MTYTIIIAVSFSLSFIVLCVIVGIVCLRMRRARGRPRQKRSTEEQDNRVKNASKNSSETKTQSQPLNQRPQSLRVYTLDEETSRTEPVIRERSRTPDIVPQSDTVQPGNVYGRGSDKSGNGDSRVSVMIENELYEASPNEDRNLVMCEQPDNYREDGLYDDECSDHSDVYSTPDKEYILLKRNDAGTKDRVIPVQDETENIYDHTPSAGRMLNCIIQGTESQRY